MVVLLQFVPYGRDHTNPPTTSEPARGSLQTRQNAKEYCSPYHSTEYQWTQSMTGKDLSQPRKEI
jgi:hypothetical protein